MKLRSLSQRCGKDSEQEIKTKDVLQEDLDIDSQYTTDGETEE